MTDMVQKKMRKILQGELKYTSSNLALNMLIARLQAKVKEDPDCMDQCIKEMDEFASKYPIVAKVDFTNISML